MKNKLFSAIFAGFCLSYNAAISSEISSSTYEIKAKKLENSRNNLSPKTGGSSFVLNKDDIENLPQGSASNINQTLLRSPSVTQDSYGQIHVRGDHSGLQYRINDVIIPEGINGFGQTLDTRFADSVTLLTGALPAQYGYRSSGVIEIKTKDRVNKDLKNGYYSEGNFGSNQTVGFNQQASGSKEGLNYFLSASYLQNNRGLENPSAGKPINNDTRQDKLFGYFSYLLNDSKKISLILANADNNFQIPSNPNQERLFDLSGANGQMNSSQIREKQKESNQFAILSLQGISDLAVDYQISFFTRYSKMSFTPDYQGDLMFNGVASDIQRSSFVNGLQADFSKELNEKNKIRFGAYVTDNRVGNKQISNLFELDTNQNQASNIPFSIKDQSSNSAKFYSAYLQDEISLSKKLMVNIGARFDRFDSYAKDQQLSPRLASTYQVSDKTKVHAAFARYFTPPRAELLDDYDPSRFDGTSNGPENFINDKVKVEKSNYYDVGIAHRFNSYVNLSVDAFFKDAKNLLDEGQFGNALIYKPFNYRDAKIYGLETSIDYKKDRISSFLNLSIQEAKARKINSSQYLFENDELEFINKNWVRPDHFQRITGSAGIAYNINKIKVGSDMLFGSGLRRGFVNGNKLPFYNQVNVFAAKEWQGFNFRIAVNNIFDLKYRLRDGSGIGVGASQFANGRNFQVFVGKYF